MCCLVYRPNALCIVDSSRLAVTVVYHMRVAGLILQTCMRVDHHHDVFSITITINTAFGTVCYILSDVNLDMHRSC